MQALQYYLCNLQEQFERDQEEMRRRYEEDKRQTDAILEQKRQKVSPLLLYIVQTHCPPFKKNLGW